MHLAVWHPFASENVVKFLRFSTGTSEKNSKMRSSIPLIHHSAPKKSPFRSFKLCFTRVAFCILSTARQWRQQVQKLQKELIDGDFTDMGRAKREAFLCPELFTWEVDGLVRAAGSIP